MVEQGFEEPCVDGSSPSSRTCTCSLIGKAMGFNPRLKARILPSTLLSGEKTNGTKISPLSQIKISIWEWKLTCSGQ